MKQRFKALTGYILFWLLFFIVARLFFHLTHFREASDFGRYEILLSFIHGFQLDISAIGYLLLLPMLSMIPGIWYNGNWFGTGLKWYTYVFIVIASGIMVSDTMLYKFWGFRMDYTVFAYLKTPEEAAASVTPLEFGSVLVGIIFISLLFIFLYKRLVDKLFYNFTRPLRWYFFMPVMLLFLGSLLIPIRGGVGVAPINAGTVYFSNKTYLNHSAVNVVWNVGSSIFNRKPSANPYNFGNKAEAEAIVSDLVQYSEKPLQVITNAKPNLLVIVVESFGSSLIGVLGGDSTTTPNFNRYASEGILFTNMYASGGRTDKAMPAIFNGYPSQPAESIMKEPKKTQSLPGIIRTLNGAGYSSSFWYGGDIDFANFHSWVINSGFQSIITMENFDVPDENAKWGVHDHVLFGVLKDSMKLIRGPFARVVLTLSSHEPFDVPMEPVFSGNDSYTKFRNSIYYTDKALGDFLDWSKSQEWWSRTLVVLVADHYRRNSGEDLVYSESIFRIPMLWLGGALDTFNIKIDKKASQVDIAPTILNQLGLNDDFRFSKDILSADSRSFAFYTYNEGFGFITDSSKYIYDHKSHSGVLTEGSWSAARETGRAYLQVLYDDFLKR